MIDYFSECVESVLRIVIICHVKNGKIKSIQEDPDRYMSN